MKGRATRPDRVAHFALHNGADGLNLLALAYGYIVYDDGRKNLGRYQQYFAIKATPSKDIQTRTDGTRQKASSGTPVAYETSM